MSTNATATAWDSMSDTEKVEWMATEVMGWKRIPGNWKGPVWESGEGRIFAANSWTPLTDWNHWRQVEEKMHQNYELFWRFIQNIHVSLTKNNMGMTRGTTICSKHDTIMSLAQDILNEAENAKTDGQSMEDALKDKNKEIADLENQLADMESQRDDLQDELDAANEEIESLRHPSPSPQSV